MQRPEPRQLLSALTITNNGDVTRVWWTPNDDGLWKLTDLTGAVQRA